MNENSKEDNKKGKIKNKKTKLFRFWKRGKK